MNGGAAACAAYGVAAHQARGEEKRIFFASLRIVKNRLLRNQR